MLKIIYLKMIYIGDKMLDKVNEMNSLNLDINKIRNDIIKKHDIENIIKQIESREEIREIADDIQEQIGEKRTNHSKRVAKEAIILSKRFNLSIKDDKIYLAGLIHDCAKIRDREKLLSLSKEYNILLNELLLDNVELIHSDLGSKIAKYKYNILDEDILNAIKYHTTGRENMSNLEKIIFLADYIEPVRNFEGVVNVRELSYRDLDLAIIKSIDQTILFLINNDKTISQDSITCRNYLLLNKEECK